MERLVECRVCDRHVRVTEAVCRFCGTSLSVPAPRRLALIVGALPLLFGCSGEDGPNTPSPSAPADAKAPNAAADEPVPVPPEPAPTTAVRPPVPEDDPGEWGQQSMPPDLGAKIEPEPVPEEVRPMATKYGGPPRPAKKYGGPPRPDPGDPVEGL